MSREDALEAAKSFAILEREKRPQLEAGRAGTEGKTMNLFGWIGGLEYPHWMMVFGTVVLVFGFIGFIFSESKNPEPPNGGETA
jgi:hypothetical protein